MKPGDRIGTATIRSVTPIRFTGTRTPRPEPAPEAAKVTDVCDHVCFALQMRLRTFSNLRDWRVRHRLAKEQREAVALMLTGYPECLRLSLAAGCTVRLTRIASRKLDANNLDDAFKAIIDALAQWLFGGRIGARDDDKRAKWKKSQIISPGVNPAVVVSIERRPPTRGE